LGSHLLQPKPILSFHSSPTLSIHDDPFLFLFFYTWCTVPFRLPPGRTFHSLPLHPCPTFCPFSTSTMLDAPFPSQFSMPDAPSNPSSAMPHNLFHFLISSQITTKPEKTANITEKYRK